MSLGDILAYISTGEGTNISNLPHPISVDFQMLILIFGCNSETSGAPHELTKSTSKKAALLETTYIP